MILPPFRLHRPKSLDEAIAIAGSCGGDFDYIGGGTDLLPNYKNRLNPRGNVIALWDVAELKQRSSHVFGAMLRLADLETDNALRRSFQGLHEAVATVASPLVRQQATLGGNLLVETRCYYFNQSHDWRAAKGYCMKADGDVCLVVPQKEICYAVYAGDTAAPLLALDATLSIRGIEGQRDVPARDFYQPDGIRKHVLERGDILTHVTLPAGAERYRSGYAKLRLRGTFDFPDAGVAAALRLSGGVVEDLRIAATAISMTPRLFPEVTDALRGERLTEAAIAKIAAAIAGESQPVRNVMFPPQYRRRMVEVFARRLLERLSAPESAAA
jgi:4-hydroxybenzoyl-CoA reductase subunit beta